MAMSIASTATIEEQDDECGPLPVSKLEVIKHEPQYPEYA